MADILNLTLFLVLLIGGCRPTTPADSEKTSGISDTTSIKAGKAPGSVEIADFNNDKFPDIAVTSESDSTVTVLLGNGKGDFIPAVNSPFFAGAGPNDMCISDFNRDGIPDLAFPNHEKKYLTVLLGDGNGSFTQAEHSPFHTEGTPHVHGITAGDFNRDGWQDLATDSWGNNCVEILFGDSNIFFGKHGKFVEVGKRPYQRLRAGDLNGDGNDDIVTTNTESNNVSVLLADGKGDFSEPKGSPFPAGDNPFGIAIGDINADGKPDLAVINSPSSMAEGAGKDGLTILINDGTGNFTMKSGSPILAGKNPNRVAIGDVNGDRINDVITSDNEGNRIYVFFMSRNSGFKSRAINTGKHPKGVAAGDLNGDGTGDIVVCNNGEDDIVIIWGTIQK